MIFFLDMDGVLNNTRVASSKPRNSSYNMFGWIDPICVGYINRWAERINELYHEDTEIVLSTTWRGAHKNATTANMMLGGMGIASFVHSDYKTRSTGMTIDDISDIRGFQIRDWLDQHPNEKNWMIIDDSSDFMEDQLHRHVHTDVYDGILHRHHIRATEIIDQIFEHHSDSD